MIREVTNEVREAPKAGKALEWADLKDIVLAQVQSVLKESVLRGKNDAGTRAEAVQTVDAEALRKSMAAACRVFYLQGRRDGYREGHAAADTTETIVGGGFLNNKRDVIYTTPDGFTATIFADLRNKGFGGKANLVSPNIEAYRKYLTTSHAVAFFWVFWVVFIGIVLFAFYYTDNNWLEDNNKKGHINA